MPLGESQHAYERDYQRLVGPKLERAIAAFAPLVAADLLNFFEAHDDVVREALRLGAACLTDPAWQELQDWIATELSDAAFAIEAASWPL